MSFGLLNRLHSHSLFDELDSAFWSPSHHYGHHPVQLLARRQAPARAMGRCVPARMSHHYHNPSLLDLFSDFGTSFDHRFDAWDGQFPLIEESLRDEGVEGSEEHPTSKARSPKKLSAKSTSSEVIKPAHSLAIASTKNFGAISRTETPDGTDYAVSLPGLELDDVKLDFDLKHRFLTVSAEKKTENKNEKNGSSFFQHVTVKRQLPLPQTEDNSPIKPEDISADLEDGVLTISIAHKKAIEASPEASASNPATMDVDSHSAETTTDPVAETAPAHETNKVEAPTSPASPSTPVEATPDDVSVEDAEE